MKTKQFALTALALLGLVATSRAATYTWDGGAANGNWSSGLNWVGDAAPTVSSHLLEFEGELQLNTTNDLLTTVSGINFRANAGAFSLSGNALTLGGDIVNNSASTHTLALDLVLSSNRTFFTNRGDIIVSGAIGESLAGRSLIKDGAFALELRGVNTYQAATQINRGAVILDASTGSIQASSAIQFGSATNYDLGNTSAFELKGDDFSIGTLSAVNRAANTVKANGVALTIASFTRGGTSSTLNFDISAANSGISFTASPTLTNGILPYATVTDSSGTDLATIVSGQVQRLTTFTEFQASGNGSTTVNYTTSGNLDRGADWANINSLTITGSGSLTSTHLQALQTYAILMREGVGDYAINAFVRSPAAATAPLVIHQYSTDGTLIFNDRIQNPDAANEFVKTGQGVVEISTTSSGSYTGATRVQQGVLDMDGNLTRTGSVVVYDGATLMGGGQFGATSATSVLIRAGGTLAGTTSEALGVTGSITLEQQSQFAMTLDYAGGDHVLASGVVTLGSDVNLVLTLATDVVPVFESPVTLLEGGSIVGNFATINGQAFGEGGTFSLSNNLGTYAFQLFNQDGEIWVQAVPEPSVGLLTGLAATLLLIRRRR